MAGWFRVERAALAAIRENVEPRSRAYALAMYQALVEAANDQRRTLGGSVCDLSRTDLAAAIGVSLRTVARVKSELALAGLLATDVHERGGVNRWTLLPVTPGPVDPTPGSHRPPSRARQGCALDPETPSRFRETREEEEEEAEEGAASAYLDGDAIAFWTDEALALLPEDAAEWDRWEAADWVLDFCRGRPIPERDLFASVLHRDLLDRLAIPSTASGSTNGRSK